MFLGQKNSSQTPNSGLKQNYIELFNHNWWTLTIILIFCPKLFSENNWIIFKTIQDQRLLFYYTYKSQNFIIQGARGVKSSKLKQMSKGAINLWIIDKGSETMLYYKEYKQCKYSCYRYLYLCSAFWYSSNRLFLYIGVQF